MPICFRSTEYEKYPYRLCVVDVPSTQNPPKSNRKTFRGIVLLREP
ncbi:hypothetical protein HMPREF0663_11586 [Hoylesella oralis ATCC 33269]|uniref:Uncharacterized protein n=1 Tax=Hoylesella oralis ATCC 33269 TaxID=873533 RepID=E7RQY5_9BACT|nr:hypothetical protein HMPREF0663_11586 [Hoylesella oralis ATCC 33269]